MIKNKRMALIMIIVIWLIMVSVISQEAIAQSIKASETLNQSCFNVNADMKAYQIVCKEHGEEYSSYYKIIREKIIQKLKRNYIDNYQNGDIVLFFIVNAKGSLTRIDVDTGKSTKNKTLINIVLSSLQEASPFPPFPKELDISQLPFSVIVSFKENND